MKICFLNIINNTYDTTDSYKQNKRLQTDDESVFQVFIDSLPLSNSSVFFGPSCDYCLASVARQLKFHQTPLITAGGLTWDFGEPKTDPRQEFYLLTRTGLDFRDSARTIAKVLEENEWSKILLIYR